MYGSVRGVPGNWYPYRDRRQLFETTSSLSASCGESVPSWGPFLAVAVGFLRRSDSRGSIHRTSQARALSTRVSESTLCPLGQSKKAIGRESPIGPCVATHPVDNRQACCFRKRLTPSRQRNGTSRVHVQTVGLNALTKKDRHRTGREGFYLDIPFYRTCPISRASSTGRCNTI